MLCGGISVKTPNNKNHMNKCIICTIERSEENTNTSVTPSVPKKTGNLLNVQILGKANKRRL
jgi:hypothetical protein